MLGRVKVCLSYDTWVFQLSAPRAAGVRRGPTGGGCLGWNCGSGLALLGSCSAPTCLVSRLVNNVHTGVRDDCCIKKEQCKSWAELSTCGCMRGVMICIRMHFRQ